MVFDIDLGTTPGITPDLAAEYARQDLDLTEAIVVGDISLVIFDQAFFLDTARNPRLAWKIPFMGGASQVVIVDAQTAETLHVIPLSLDHGPGQSGLKLDMQDAENEANADDDWCYFWSDDPFVADEGYFSPKYDGEADATLGFSYIKLAYEFYHTTFKRHSYDNKGTQLELFIFADVKNASFHHFCELIQFKSGWIDFDIMVHEFTHGVISEGNGLDYSNQSGALNESYADVMAVFAERIMLPNNLAWWLGDNRTGMSGAIRSFNNPPLRGQPDHMDDFVTLPNSKSGDWGGVHTNSGIMNRAAYIISEGMVFSEDTQPFDGFTDYELTINGIGGAKLLALYYDIMQNLPSNAKFSQAVKATLKKADTWADSNTNGFTDDDVCDIRNGFAMVGLHTIDLDCDGIADSLDDDIDGDGVINSEDNCEHIANPKQWDKNHDNIGDACQEDPDGDGIPAGGIHGDNCPDVYNPDQIDLDHDGKGKACDDDEDDDFDDDGKLNDEDNCPFIANPFQENVDEHLDNDGDACDPDDDGDGFSNDNCPYTANPDQADKDGDGAGDVCDKCSEVADVFGWTQGANYPNPNGEDIKIEPEPIQPDSDGDGIPDACDDNLLLDGLPWHLLNLGLRPDGSSHMGELRGEPKSILNVPLPPCPPDDRFSSENYRGQLYFEGLDPNIYFMVVDGDGGNAAKPDPMNGGQSLDFRPFGGQIYSLLFIFGPDYPSGQVTPFSLTFSCGELEPVIDEDDHEESDTQEEVTPTSTPEPDSVPPTATGIRNAACREGGETAYPEVDFLLQDQTAPIVGISEDGNYYLITGPTWGIDCWVWKDLVETEGDLSILPVVPYPPLPTPTFTPVPARPTPTPTPCTSTTGAGCP